MVQYAWLFAFVLLIGCIRARGQDTLSQKNECRPSGEITGLFFGDYAYKLQADPLQRGDVQYSKLKKNYNGFDIRRIYLGYRYRFSPKISSRLVLAHESSSVSDPSMTDALTDDNRSVYIKYAEIRFGGVIPRADIIFGQQATPTFSLADDVWDYRPVEKTLTDMRDISESTDLGVAISGRIGKSERFGYDLMVGNNNGARAGAGRFKKLYTAVYTYLFDKKLVLQVNYEYNRTAPYRGIHGHNSLYRAFAGYETGRAAVGIALFRQTRADGVSYTAADAPSDTLYADARPSGVSIFYRQTLQENKLGLFSRVDFYDPDAAYSAADHYMPDYPACRQVFATVGLDFIPYKNIHLMPNLWYDGFLHKAAGGRDGSDLVARITVYFVFDQ